MDETPQIAEEQLVMTMDKAQEKSFKDTKLGFRCFLLTSARAKRIQDGDQSIRLYTAISLQPRCFSEIHTYVCKKLKCSFDSGTQVEAKRTYLQFYPVTDRQTDRQTDGQIAITLRLHSG